MKNKLFCIALSSTLFFQNAFTTPPEEPVRYLSQFTFSYQPRQLQALKSLPKPTVQLTNQGLLDANRYGYDLLDILDKKNKLSPAEHYFFKSYLATALKDFFLITQLISAEVSSSGVISGKALGNFHPVVNGIVKLFITQPITLDTDSTDPYSQAIADLIVTQAAAHLKEDRKALHDYPIKKGDIYWSPKEDTYFGLNLGSMKTLYLSSSSEFRPTKPTDDPLFWKAQITAVKEAMKSVDDTKMKAINFWANLSGPDSGDWEFIAQKYMTDHQIPLKKQLIVRATLLNGIRDATSAVFDAKYTYWMKRPEMRDASIHPLIETPQHPSFPAGHSVTAKTASTILTSFFPENQAEWDNLAKEAGLSRIWAGIHFPIDNEQGNILGEKVAFKVLKQ